MRDALIAAISVALEGPEADRGLEAVPGVGDGLGQLSLRRPRMGAGLDEEGL